MTPYFHSDGTSFVFHFLRHYYVFSQFSNSAGTSSNPIALLFFNPLWPCTIYLLLCPQKEYRLCVCFLLLWNQRVLNCLSIVQTFFSLLSFYFLLAHMSYCVIPTALWRVNIDFWCRLCSNWFCFNSLVIEPFPFILSTDLNVFVQLPIQCVSCWHSSLTLTALRTGSLSLLNQF